MWILISWVIFMPNASVLTTKLHWVVSNFISIVYSWPHNKRLTIFHIVMDDTWLCPSLMAQDPSSCPLKSWGFQKQINYSMGQPSEPCDSWLELDCTTWIIDSGENNLLSIILAQTSAPIPLWGQPPSTVIIWFVFITDLTIVSSSRGRIVRKFTTWIEYRGLFSIILMYTNQIEHRSITTIFGICSAGYGYT